MDRTEHHKMYLERIHSFLISNDDSLIFPSSLTMSTEDLLVNIAKDTNFLKQNRFGDDCMNLVAKLTGVLDKTKDVFSLGYEFKFDDKRKKVMVYTKIPVCAFQNVIVPSKPLRKPNIIKENNEDSIPKSIMSSFKITFLNATLKFVKDDSQMILSYSNMATEQAYYVKQIIEQCMERNGTKSGFKGLYDPLAEALKIFSLKYDFKLYIENVKDMKQVRFEKTRKNTDTNKIEGTRIINEDTTDSDSSLKPVRKSKSQKILTTLIDAMTHITPAFKLRTLTELREFLQDKTRDNQTFSNLNLYEQQFISHWQTLTQRVEAMRSLDVPGQMVLDEIRGFLKKKNYRVKVELGISSQNRFVKLTKLLNPNIPAVEDVAVQLRALDLGSKTKPAISHAGQSSSGDSSSDSNTRNRTKFDRKVEKLKTSGLKNDWIQATLTKLRNFLQNEAEASCIITSITELQAAFLTKWQNLLSMPEVINTYPTDVQVLMHDVCDAASANKKKFRVKFSLTKFRNDKRDAIFTKLPTYSDVPTNTNLPANVHNENGKKGEKPAPKVAVQRATNYPASVKIELQKSRNQENKLSEKITGPKTTDIPPPENKKKTEISDVTVAPAPKKSENKAQNSANATKKLAPVTIEPKQSENKAANSENVTKKLAPVTVEPKQSENKAQNSANATKKLAPVTIEPKQSENKAANSENATKKMAPVTIESKQSENKADNSVNATKKLAPVLLEPKQSENKAQNSANGTKKLATVSLEPKQSKNKAVNSENATKKLAPVTVEPKQSENKAANSENATKKMAPVTIESKQSENKADNSANATKKLAPVSLEPKQSENKAQNSANGTKKLATVSLDPKQSKNKAANSENATKKLAPVTVEPKQSENKAQNSANATKKLAPVTVEPKQSENKAQNSANATKKLAPVTFEPQQNGNKDETSANSTITRPTTPILKSTSLTSLNKKKSRANKVIKLPEATVKLIEGLKQPLVSERGMKMMRQMGWEGGPLGPRGEGIAEPLMPDLDRGKRAGLGAPKPQFVVAASKSTDDVVALKEKVVKSVDHAWKNVVMKTLLGMVKGESMKTEIICEQELTMKDWIYVVNVATAFNNRDKSKKSADNMSAILQLVTDDELMLTVAWSRAKTAIFLILSKYNENIRISRDKWSNVLQPNDSLTKKNRKKLVKDSATKNEEIKHPVMTEATTTNNNCSTKDVKPKDVKPKDVKPKEVKPKEVKPKDVKSKDVKPMDVKPKDVKPKDVKPKDVKTTDDNMNDIIASVTEITLSEKELSKERKPMALSLDAVDSAQKRTKTDYVKHINIEPKDYPHTKMTKNMAAEIQKSIKQTIDYTQVLPLLKCHGIQDGVLSYSCHNKESLEIIQNVIKTFDLNITLTEETEKGSLRMSLKLNTFIDESVGSILKNLETFNLGLSTKDWVFIKKEQYSDFIVIFVDMDLDSYKFILSRHFKLYVGIDEARFSVVWD